MVASPSCIAIARKKPSFKLLTVNVIEHVIAAQLTFWPELTVGALACTFIIGDIINMTANSNPINRCLCLDMFLLLIRLIDDTNQQSYETDDGQL